jgi:hypothetical protein
VRPAFQSSIYKGTDREIFKKLRKNYAQIAKSKLAQKEYAESTEQKNQTVYIH